MRLSFFKNGPRKPGRFFPKIIFSRVSLVVVLLVPLWKALPATPAVPDDWRVNWQKRQQRNKILRQKWQMDDDRSAQPVKYPVSEALAQKMLQVFELPAGSEVVGEKGTRFYLDRSALQLPAGFGKQPLRVVLMEVLEPFEYYLAGLNLQTPGGQLLESGGMVYVRVFAGGKKVPLIAPIRVRVPRKIGGGGFHTYNLSGSGEWEKKQDATEVDAASGAESADPDCVEGECQNSMLYRAFPKIHELGWWNLDKPAPNITCVAGRLRGPAAKSYKISMVGVDKRGFLARYPEMSFFQINALTNTRVILIAETPSGYMGVSKIITTGSGQAFAGREQQVKCPVSATIRMKKVPEAVVKDRAALKKFLDLPVDI